MDQGTTNEEMERGYKRLTDYTQCDTTAIYSLYQLISESLPYLMERKQLQRQTEQHVTFSINGFDPHNLRGPWWQDDD